MLGPAFDLLQELRALGVEVRVHGDAIQYRPKSLVTAALAERIEREKPGLIAILKDPGRITPGAQELLERCVPLDAWFAANRGGTP